MQKNQKTIIGLVIGGLILACCIIVVIGAVFLFPMRRYGNVQVSSDQTLPLVTDMTEPTTAPIVLPSGETPGTQLPTMGVIPMDSPTATVTPPRVDYEGVSYFLAAEIGRAATTENIAEVAGDPADAFPGTIHPTYLEFSIDGYPISGTYHEPKIRIYPAQDYGAMDPAVAQIVLQLQQVLRNKPEVMDSLPFLPIWNAAQSIQASVKYLEFQNGSGVRFLTQYGQAAWPINNKDMFYTFQGLSSDGQWYVSAIFPVSHPSLPIDGESIMQNDPEAFVQNYQDYLTQTESQLSALPEDSFTPSLLAMDALIQSLQIK